MKVLITIIVCVTVLAVAWLYRPEKWQNRPGRYVFIRCEKDKSDDVFTSTGENTFILDTTSGIIYGQGFSLDTGDKEKPIWERGISEQRWQTVQDLVIPNTNYVYRVSYCSKYSKGGKTLQETNYFLNTSSH